MIILHDNFKTKLKYNTFIALGSFDGLHKGHLTLINKVLELSKSNGNIKSMVNTFANHPLTIVDKDKVPKLIMDNDTKAEILDKLGIDIVNFALFNEDLMKMSPENFIFNMIKCYNAVGIVVGFNYRFGHKNLGDIELLKKLSEEYNFKLFIINPIEYNENVISSTRIRTNIGAGKMEDVNNMLLKPYMLKGKVISGKKLGRTIGFPTANLEYNKEFAIPKKGVYYTLVKYKEKIYKGITNIGTNPTIGINELTIETYILDFTNEIYNEYIKIYFISRIRDEQKFNSLAELKNQLEKDKKFAKMRNIEIKL
ncbi:MULTISPECIES: bifunctional riboflavin kinase/FAD synthetase [Clostridium]|jgi:riboflavin kinase/FMN adenylyltransferase|uniref:bifunctional riboflavin kinase/FAD synthetase n=1 Tax=Clostridium TaxID=1485 RepID=UPI000287FF0F|nr:MULTISPECIES: bifunctional riboflavin kinase/FAD synthetase [Clostridium]MDF2502537.1 riboflavin kinase/FMN adenylyltransferase [Clostridium sp.]